MKNAIPNRLSNLAILLLIAMITCVAVWVGVLHKPIEPKGFGGIIFIAMLGILLISGLESRTDPSKSRLIWTVTNNEEKQRHWRKVGILALLGVLFYCSIYLVGNSLELPPFTLPLLFFLREAIIVRDKRDS